MEYKISLTNRKFAPRFELPSRAASISAKSEPVERGHFRTHAPQRIAFLFDQLIGCREKRVRDVEAESLGGFDGEVVAFGRLLDLMQVVPASIHGSRTLS
jgi:hypothetical protein